MTETKVPLFEPYPWHDSITKKLPVDHVCWLQIYRRYEGLWGTLMYEYLLEQSTEKSSYNFVNVL